MKTVSDADEVLSCDHMRSFWIIWHDRTLAVGRGDAIGSNEYLRHSAASSDVIEPLHAVKLESHSADEAKWEVPRETGEKRDLKFPIESYVIKCVMF